MRIKIAAIIWLLIISSCMKVKSKEEAAKPEAPVLAAKSTEVTYEIIAGEKPNDYRIKFHFHEPRSNVQVTKSWNDQKSVLMAGVVSQEWTDDQALPGEEITYEFSDLKLGQADSWQTVKVRVPKDLVVEEKMDLAQVNVRSLFQGHANQLELKTFRRLFLKSGGELFLRHYNVRMQLEELISEGGHIATFPAGAKAEVGVPGASGGLIEIRAEKARGDLFFDLRGESGGDGANGARPDESLRGAKGKTGRKGRATVQAIPDDPFHKVLICQERATDGGPGERGKEGYRGDDGKHGGNTGDLQLIVKDSFQFVPKFTRTQGYGGQFGHGGEGGRRGIGGDPGPIEGIGPGDMVINLDSCQGQRGPDGEDGPPGKDGTKGTDGLMGSYCETLGDKPKLCL